MKLFSLDSSIGRAIAVLADLVIVNVLFLFSCMPVVTIGAASAALYDTVHAMLTQECGVVGRHYFSAFGKCFKKGTVLFLLSVPVLAVVTVNLMLALSLDSAMGIASTGVVLASLVLALGVMAVLPMKTFREPKEKLTALVKESFLLALAGSWRTIVAIVLNVLPVVLFLFFPGLFLQSAMFWFLMGFSILAYVNNWLLLKAVEPAQWEELHPVKKE